MDVHVCVCVWERRYWGSEDEWCGCVIVVGGDRERYGGSVG